MNVIYEGLTGLDAVDILVRATVLLAGAVMASLVLGKRRPEVSHLCWTAAFILLLAVPAVATWAPRVEVAVLPASPTATEYVPTEAVPGELPAAAEAGVRSQPEAPPPPSRLDSRPLPAAGTDGGSSWGTTAVGVWMVGVLGALGSLFVGVLRFRAFRRRGRPVRCPRILDRASVLTDRLRLRQRVQLLLSEETGTPLAGGFLRPVVILPTGATEWPVERIDVVLAHELIHVRRHDAIRQLLGQVALAVYWFHPLSWLASRLSVTSREQACDEQVVALGTRPSDYARHLIHLSEGVWPAPRMAALPMVQRTQLESRIMSILTPAGRRRSALVTSATLVSFCLFGVTAAVAIPVALDSTEPVPDAVTDAEVQKPGRTMVGAVGASSTVPDDVVVGRLLVAQELECAPTSSGRFNGSISTRSGRTTMAGWHNGDRTIQRYVDGLRLCLRTRGEVVMEDDGSAVRAVGRDGWLVLESEGESLHRLVVTEGPSGIERAWSIDGEARPFDETGREWRDHVLAILDAHWEVSRLRGQVSSLRGEISSMRGHVSSLRGRISSHRGHVSSLRGQVSSMRGHVSSLRGNISSMRGRVSSLNGEISSLQGRMSGLRSAARATGDEETRQRLEDEEREYESRIQEVRDEIERYDLDARVAEVNREIEEYDLDGRVAEVNRELEAYDLDAKVAELEEEIREYDLDGRIEEKLEEIEALDADRRSAEIESSVAPRVEALMRLLERSRP